MSATDTPAPGRTTEIAPGVVQVCLPLPSRPTIINVYLVSLGDGDWALIDTGVARPESRASFHEACARLGIEARSIRHLIGTHHHPDHFGASSAYREDSGGTVHLHPLELERIEYALQAGSEDMVRHSRRNGMPIPASPVDAPRPMDVWAGTFQPTVNIDHHLEDGQVLELGRRRLRVVWTPGHTPGHCCILDLETGALIVGDHLLPKITPHVGVYATGPRNPLGDFLASQEKAAALDVAVVGPAHGPVYRDHRHRAHQIIAHHEYRLREVADAIRPRPVSAYDVAQAVFPWVFEPGRDRFHAGAAVMETLAHLELLRARGGAVTEEREGVVRYRHLELDARGGVLV